MSILSRLFGKKEVIPTEKLRLRFHKNHILVTRPKGWQREDNFRYWAISESAIYLYGKANYPQPEKNQSIVRCL